jgi:hypothetical protein
LAGTAVKFRPEVGGARTRYTWEITADPAFTDAESGRTVVTIAIPGRPRTARLAYADELVTA